MTQREIHQTTRKLERALALINRVSDTLHNSGPDARTGEIPLATRATMIANQIACLFNDICDLDEHWDYVNNQPK